MKCKIVGVEISVLGGFLNDGIALKVALPYGRVVVPIAAEQGRNDSSFAPRDVAARHNMP